MNDAGFRGCLSRWLRLLRSWWQVDRVRVSPREGRLLRLTPPCIVRIAGRYAQVHHRRTGETHSRSYVCYECTVDDEPAQLWAMLTGEHYAQVIHWNHAGEQVQLDAEEIEVFG